jgi:tetratricopeptide (TPR) repeat protein
MRGDQTELPALSVHEEAVEIAVRSQGWTATWLDGFSVRLAGGEVDGRALFVTDMLAFHGAASVHTRLPLLIPAEQRFEALLLCSAINASGGAVVSIDPDGVPVVFSKCLLAGDSELSAATIVDLVCDHRLQAVQVSVAFNEIACGEPASSVAAAMDLTAPVPFTEPFTAASRLDLSLGPEPPLETQKSFDALGPDLTEREMTALVRLKLFGLQQPDASPCAGPLVVHSDGALECYGCTNPESRVHVSTASCRPRYRLGNGHLCSRCDRRADDGFEAMIERLQEKLSPGSPWERNSASYWSGTVETPERLEFWVSLPWGDNPSARVEAVLVNVDVPPAARPEVALFCAAANRFFESWNLYLASDENGDHVISAGTFPGDESGTEVPLELLEAMVRRTLRAGVVATQALQAVVAGMNAREAVKLADRHDDMTSFGLSHQQDWNGIVIDDAALIDDAFVAISAFTTSPPLRRSPTQLSFGVPTPSGRGATVFVDARDETVQVTCYSLDPAPEERLPALAELMSLIGATGVGFKLALDLEHRLVGLRNWASFAGVTGDRELLLRDLIRYVAYGPLLYEGPLRQVAFEEVDPAAALREVEHRFAVHRAEKKIAAFDRTIEDLGDVPEPAAREEVAAGFVGKALTLSDLGRADEAINVYDRLIERFADATEPELRGWVATALLQKAFGFANLGRPEEAIATYDQLIERSVDPPDPAVCEQLAQALRYKGVALRELGRLEDALAVYGLLVARFGDAPEPLVRKQVACAFFEVGITLGELGRPADEIAAYEQLIERFGADPEPAVRERVADALLNKGFELRELGRPEEAIATYDRLIERSIDPPEPTVRAQLATALLYKGVALRGLGRLEEALAVYGLLVTRFGDAPEPPVREQVAWAFFGTGITLGELGRPADEIAAYEQLIERFGADPEPAVRERVADALFNKGVELRELGRPGEAIATYDRLIEDFADAPEPALREQAADVMINRAIILGELGLPDEEIAAYDRLIEHFGDGPELALRQRVAEAMILQGNALVARGLALSDRRPIEQAIVIYDRVVERLGDAPEPALKEQVAEALLCQAATVGVSDPHEAMALYDQLIERFGDAPEAELRDQVARARIDRERLTST